MRALREIIVGSSRYGNVCHLVQRVINIFRADSRDGLRFQDKRFGFGFPGAIIAVFLGVGVLPSQAQWATQTINLRPGWNAVFIEVQPEPRECDFLFGDLPVESVWLWNRRFSPVQFIQDPETLVPGEADWLTWARPAHPARPAMNLFTLLGGRPYLIKLPADAPLTQWQLHGRPVLRPPEWLSDSWNLAGFPVAAINPPTFQQFFAGSPAHAGQPVYVLNANGNWQQVSNPSTTALRGGEAFWIRTKGHSTFAGPLAVQPEQRGGIEYGRILTEQTLRIRNHSTAPRTVSLKKLSSLAPLENGFPAYAGEVPLAYFKMDLANDEYAWAPLPDTLTRTALAPGQEWVIRLEAVRREMAAFAPPAGVTDVLYQSLLEITDNAGSRIIVPVSARGIQLHGPGFAPQALHLAAMTDPPHPRAGLWVGTATIGKVNQPASISSPTVPVQAGSDFNFRLILHVDRTGQARLLQRVMQMWKNGTTKPDPDDPLRQIVDEPGRFVLLADEELLPNFSGAAVRDGQPVGRRLSSAAFAFRDPIPFSGAGDFGANNLSCQIHLDYDDPLNPFKHKYHPDHDNLDERFEEKLPEGVESFSITRELALEFSATDPNGLALAGWGDNQLGGIYKETITGLHQQALFLEGSFRLQQVSRIPVLNQ